MNISWRKLFGGDRKYSELQLGMVMVLGLFLGIVLTLFLNRDFQVIHRIDKHLTYLSADKFEIVISESLPEDVLTRAIDAGNPLIVVDGSTYIVNEEGYLYNWYHVSTSYIRNPDEIAYLVHTDHGRVVERSHVGNWIDIPVYDEGTNHIIQLVIKDEDGNVLRKSPQITVYSPPFTEAVVLYEEQE
ncbi:MAG: hypothetical protein ACOZAO_04885 [Patescibacteria group bacterium]